jgi:hypothetical protein
MAHITGHTRVFGILADPIHHVQTPQGINRLLDARAFDGIMVPMHVHPEGLSDLVQGLRRMHNLGGFVVTVPHKTAMPALCDALTPAAARIGAVNASLSIANPLNTKPRVATYLFTDPTQGFGTFNPYDDIAGRRYSFNLSMDL